MAAVHSVTFAINFVTALAIWRLPDLEENRYHLVVRTLILSDCFIPLSGLPMSVASFLNCGWVGGQVSCTLSAFFSTAFLSWSALIVVIMCALRFLAVTKPLFYRNQVTYTRVRMILFIALVWGCSHLVLPIVGLGKFRLHARGLYCALDITPSKPHDRTLVYMTIVEGCLVVVALVYFSAGIVLTVKKKRRVSSTLSLQQQRGAGIEKIMRQHGGFAAMTSTIVVLYWFCFVPFLSYRIWLVYWGESRLNEDVYYVTELIAHVNPLLNPLVFVACSRQYRSCINKLFIRVCVHKCTLLMPQAITETYGDMGGGIEMRKMSALSTKTDIVMI
ncbi:predicted protein [Nematostella vectensis]|uniref:G-protein coupled receptors family 1 profile domain-containing protein n=2 Tax=Nematostella vectensis TaxID=45351 RepID=A7S383_NEMVE|nr:predicted protein [Nematostella vectensis]|eukprot:XP_001633868.1 predicted protein [Nematostella vectensis]